jgi:type IV pilus assembly protein PilF
MGTRSPKNLRLLSWLALCCLLLAGCVTETSDRLAQNKDPKKAVKAYVEAGMRYMQRNQMENAHRTLTRAYDIDPNDPAVNNALALFFSIEGDKSQTEKHYKKAISTDPKFSQARNNYAAFLFKEERYKDAIVQLEQVTTDYRYDRRFTAFENLGLCYLKVGDTEQAEKSFNRALKLNANMPVSLLELAQIHFEKGDHATAYGYLTSHEKLVRPSPRQLWLGIRLQRILGDQNKLASYELALRNMFPGSPEFQAYMASRSL